MDIVEHSLDYHLDQVKANIQEIDTDLLLIGSGIVAAGVGSLLALKSVVQFLWGASLFHRQIKIDKQRSKWVNNVLKSGNKWVVHKWPDEAPNAFAITGNHVFITTGLTKLLNQREQTGILLHEIYHNKDLHSWKQVGAESAFTYLIVFCAMASTTVVFPGLGILVAYIMHHAFSIAYGRLVGRRHELAADKFAVKHGYGKDLVSAFEKMESWAKKINKNVKCDKICQIERKISEEIDEHPPIKKRIEIILRKSNDLNKLLKMGSLKSITNYVSGVFKNNG